jgi:hypothetical protein
LRDTGWDHPCKCGTAALGCAQKQSRLRPSCAWLPFLKSRA